VLLLFFYVKKIKEAEESEKQLGPSGTSRGVSRLAGAVVGRQQQTIGISFFFLLLLCGG
jgi:hypothetical protein